MSLWHSCLVTLSEDSLLGDLQCIEYDVIFPICCCNPDVFDCFFSFQEAVFTRFVVLVKFACRKNI